MLVFHLSQIIRLLTMDITLGINVYNWFQKASKGGILEMVFAGRRLALIALTMVIFMYKMQLSSMVHLLIRLNV